MSRILLAVALAITLVGLPVATSEAAPPLPTVIRVFRIHHRGSSVPARIDTVPFQLYVERVMASGAWPAHKPMESLKAGATVIMQRARWLVAHPQRGYVWHGRRYDIHDGSVRKGLRGTGADSGQFYRSDVRVHSRIKRAVEAVWGTSLYKQGRFIKPGWTGEARQPNGWRLPEDSVTRLARRGWTWIRILHHFLDPVEIRVPRTRRVPI